MAILLTGWYHRDGGRHPGDEEFEEEVWRDSLLEATLELLGSLRFEIDGDFFGIDWSRGGRSCDLLLLLLGLLEMVHGHPQMGESGS